MLQNFFFISDTCGKLGPAEILDRPPISTAITAALASLLSPVEQAAISLRRRLSWQACGHQVARSRGWTGGRPRIGDMEAAPLCLSMCLREAWARRATREPTMG
ncbi:hypothetical protein OAO87_04805 [bacterium]|nr:hypothetical protein [bacterium]